MLSPNSVTEFTPINGKIKYAVDKRKLDVVGDEGKEYEMEIVKKILRSPGDSKQ